MSPGGSGWAGGLLGQTRTDSAGQEVQASFSKRTHRAQQRLPKRRRREQSGVLSTLLPWALVGAMRVQGPAGRPGMARGGRRGGGMHLGDGETGVPLVAGGRAWSWGLGPRVSGFS